MAGPTRLLRVRGTPTGLLRVRGTPAPGLADPAFVVIAEKHRERVGAGDPGGGPAPEPGAPGGRYYVTGGRAPEPDFWGPPGPTPRAGPRMWTFPSNPLPPRRGGSFRWPIPGPAGRAAAASPWWSLGLGAGCQSRAGPGL
jgi:hypothetical protein